MPSDNRNSDEFQVHFRGVAAYVANTKPGYVTEVLFPKADEEPTGEGDSPFERQKATDDESKKKMHHADTWEAIAHHSGALIIENGIARYRHLSGKQVKLAGSSGDDDDPAGAKMDPDFLTQIPSLNDIIRPDKKLELLKDKKSKRRIATRFILNGTGDDTATAQCNAGGGWQFTAPNGSTPDLVDYALEVLWTTKAEAPLVFEITDLRTGKHDAPIELSDPSVELYFYNFDIFEPTKDQLLEVKDPPLGKTDVDFKWAYKLFEKAPKKWEEWLEGTPFPAPVYLGPSTVSVSTCFELVWTGD